SLPSSVPPASAPPTSAPPSFGAWPPPPSDTTGTFTLSVLPGWTPPDIATTNMHDLSEAWTNMQKELKALVRRDLERQELASAQAANESSISSTLNEQMEEQPEVKPTLQSEANMFQSKEKKGQSGECVEHTQEIIEAVLEKFGFRWKSPAGAGVSSASVKFEEMWPEMTLGDPWLWALMVGHYLLHNLNATN